jgi:superfamily II DNA or RNA helicase
MTHKVTYLLRDEALLSIAPSNPFVEKYLTYVYKEIVPREDTPWITYTKRTKTPAYEVLCDINGHKIIQTYAGFFRGVKKVLVDQGFEVVETDTREPFPAPQLDKMYGFRFSQGALLTLALIQNEGGTIEAPTRYGKTTLVINTLRAFPNLTTVVTAPGKDLIKDLYGQIKKSIPKREVVLMGAGSRVKYPSEDITVCSMDSLHKCDPGRTRLLIADEIHASVTDSRIDTVAAFVNARKFGFSATPEGRFDGRDLLVRGLFGAPLAVRTYREAVEEGAICPIQLIFLRIPYTYSGQDRRHAYNAVMHKSREFCEIVRVLSQEVIPTSYQTLFFISHEQQADMLLEYLPSDGVIAMAKKMTDKEREALYAELQTDRITRCIASRIYAQGVTFKDIRCMVNCEGGGGSTSSIQKPGRLAEIRDGKTCGVVFDFKFEAGHNANRSLAADSDARLAVYEKKDYDIHICNTIDEVKSKFQELTKNDKKRI